MGKHHKRKQKTVQLVKEHSGYKPKPLPASDWEQLAGNPTLPGAFQELSVRLQRAQATATQRSARSGIEISELVDYSHALQVIDAHPELVPYLRELQSGERREMLRVSTMSPDYLRQSPTQSYPTMLLLHLIALHQLHNAINVKTTKNRDQHCFVVLSLFLLCGRR